jgi:hypothetical protein
MRRYVLALSLILLALEAAAADPLRIAILEPLSGPFANAGEGNTRAQQLAIETINARGGVVGGRRLEPLWLDHKMSPQEAAVLLKRVADEKIRILVQGTGANVTVALSDAIARHNERSPQSSILFLIFSGPDPVIANEPICAWTGERPCCRPPVAWSGHRGSPPETGSRRLPIPLHVVPVDDRGDADELNLPLPLMPAKGPVPPSRVTTPVPPCGLALESQRAKSLWPSLVVKVFRQYPPPPPSATQATW